MNDEHYCYKEKTEGNIFLILDLQEQIFMDGWMRDLWQNRTHRNAVWKILSRIKPSWFTT